MALNPQSMVPESRAPWVRRLYIVIFEADTPAGKAFDIGVLVAILCSVVAVSLDSVASLQQEHGLLLRITEWFFTILFSFEYILRVISVRRPLRYMLSFFGIIDLLAILPTYASLFIAGSQSLTVIRAFRLLRIFRILKLARFVREAESLWTALVASGRKITVFIGTVLTLVLLLGALMYLIEGEEGGFTSIPQSAYWAIVTMTTVGYGDIAPVTPGGKLLASLVMLLGYGVIAVPTGIVTGEMIRDRKANITTRSCPTCTLQGHDADAEYCKYCGDVLL